MNILYTIIPLFLFSHLSLFSVQMSPQELSHFPVVVDDHIDDDSFKKRPETLQMALSASLDTKNSSDKLNYKHFIESISNDGSEVKLKNGLILNINWWYRSYPQKWKNGDQLYITYSFDYQQIEIQHSVRNEVAWASSNITLPNFLPAIQSIQSGSSRGDTYYKITLNHNDIFQGISGNDLSTWCTKDQIVIFANSENTYQLWNLNRNSLATCKLLAKSILDIETRLKKKVFQQPEATKAIATALLSHAAGLKINNRPIAVFLFLGPTGVGKTELAKVLAEELYNDASKILRFDMSHFSEPHSVARLIGSPPGYVNHEEGGQLTEPLKENTEQIVLLDELEKAHPQVLKAFLPVFDEGFIVDNKNIRVDCSQAIFIMTSNLCGLQIAKYYNQGLVEEEILNIIEPTLMEALSPELYNRIDPVLFRPLAKETMYVLVDRMLQQLKDRLLSEKEIEIFFDESIKNFLATKGYHPLLGARPLKKLIEKRIIADLAYYIIQNTPLEGTVLMLFYDEENDSVIIN